MMIACLLILTAEGQADGWQFLTNVPGAHYVYDLMATEKAVYMLLGDASGDAMGLYRYTLATAQTDFVGKPGEPLQGVHVAGLDDDHMWLGERSTPSDAIALWHSSDHGDTWNPQIEEGWGETFCVRGSTDGGQIYVASHFELCFKASSDSGSTWISWGGCSDQLPFGARAMAVDSFNPLRAYAAVMDWSSGQTFVVETTDGGMNWEVLVVESEIPAFAGVHASKFLEGDFGVADNSGQIHVRSSDVWSHVPDTNLHPVFGIAQPLWDGGAWWISGEGLADTLRVGRFDGNQWADWDEGLPTVILGGSDLHKVRMYGSLSGDVFLYASDAGLWAYERPLSSVPDEWSRGLRLASTAYPNPFESDVTFALRDLPRETYRVAVYSIGGRRIRSLYEGRLEGRAHLTWDAVDSFGRAVASGVYILRLEDSGGAVQAEKKVLLVD
jgi:hypothetical protein